MKRIVSSGPTWSYRWLAACAAALVECGGVGAVEPVLTLDGSVEITQTSAAEPALKVSSFQGIVPGKSSFDDVKSILGEPQVKGTDAGATLWEYATGPFPRVEILGDAQRVASIVVHLAAPGTVQAVQEELKLGKFRFAEVRDDDGGELLGLVIPERGVVLGLAAGSRDQVERLILEPLTADPFLWRVQQTDPRDFQTNLADLQRAADLGTDNAEIHLLRARYLAFAGRLTAAAEAIDKAVELDPQSLENRLTRLEVLAELGKFAPAASQAERLRTDQRLSDLQEVRLLIIYGSLLADGGSHDYAQAVEQHLQAIQLGTPLATVPDEGERRFAKQLLIRAHLEVARAIASGAWDNKPAVLKKWLRTAEELVQGTIEFDGGDPLLRLQFCRQMLEVYAASGMTIDPEDAFHEATQVGQRLLETNEDSLFRDFITSQLADVAASAMECQQRQNDANETLRYADHAADLLSQLAPEREPTPRLRYRAAKVYFAIGSVHGIARDDHTEAVRWFEKAVPYFDDAVPEQYAAELGLHGERFVSMGVSYWRADYRDEAAKLTRRGVVLLQQAVQRQLIAERLLAIPYANLAEMYQTLGNDQDAERFAELAERVQANRR